MMTEEDTRQQLKLHGCVPWTLTIADAIESGHEWEPADLIRVLRNAQKRIDDLTIERNLRGTP